MSACAPQEGHSFCRHPWSLLVVALVGLYLFPYSRTLNNPNERTRVLQARALVAHGQLHIGEAVDGPAGRIGFVDLYGRRSRGPFVNDVALVCDEPDREPPRCTGKLYPAKAPGAALLGVPALAAARAVGFVPDGPRGETRATWVLRYGGVWLWFLLGLWVLGRELRLAGAAPAFVQRAVLAAGLATSAFPYAISFVGHSLAGVALVCGLSLIHAAMRRGDRRSHALAFAAGHVTGWAVLFEYHAAVAVLVVSGFILTSATRRRLVPVFALGGLTTLALHSVLHLRMFGSPLKTGHFFLLSAHNRDSQAAGFLGIDGLHGDALANHLFDPYMGLLPMMPWLGLGLCLGAWTSWRKAGGSGFRAVARAASLVAVAYLLFVSSLGNARVMNGWSIGPRYLVPALLPMALVAAHGWWWATRTRAWLGRICAGLAAASCLIVVSITAAYPSPPPAARAPFGELAVPLLAHGHGVRNLAMAWGPASLWLLGAAVVLIAFWIAAGRDDGAQRWLERAQVRRAGLGVLVAIGFTCALASYRPSAPAEAQNARDFCVRTLEGVAPETQRGLFD